MTDDPCVLLERRESPFSCVLRVGIDPHGQGRPRATARGKFARLYKAPKDREWEAELAALIDAHRPAEPLAGPLRVDIVAAKRRPKTLQRKKDPDGYLWRTSVPDLDNCAKAVLDALDSWWVDDRHVCSCDLRGVWASKNSSGHLIIRIAEITSPPDLDTFFP